MTDDVIDTTVELRNCYIVLVEGSDMPRNDTCIVCECGTRYCRVGLQYGKNGGERSLYWSVYVVLVCCIFRHVVVSV